MSMRRAEWDVEDFVARVTEFTSRWNRRYPERRVRWTGVRSLDGGYPLLRGARGDIFLRAVADPRSEVFRFTAWIPDRAAREIGHVSHEEYGEEWRYVFDDAYRCDEVSEPLTAGTFFDYLVDEYG